MPIVASPDDPGDSQGVERFTFQGNEVRAQIENGEPWWVAADVCSILDLHTGRALARLDDDEKGMRSTHTPGGLQLLAYVNEPGLYSLVLGSRKPRAKDFKRWITHEVIPSIRKTGSYGRPSLPSNRDLALMVIAEADRADVAEARVKELEPAASSWQTLASAEGDYSVADAAKILSRDGGISTGRNRLFASLLEMRWLYRQQSDSRPRAMQTAVDRGWLSELPQSHAHPETGDLVLDPPQVRITVKGLHELHKRLGGDGLLAIAS
ncbi:phage antirepressor KilAC domain-containing protein [Streptomyces tendae]|uniref:phage antirepressor KilAC domain-containing protein n=1 Tax=Streptomyces tendae TaxID=1932 RepID=UPI003664EB46